MDGKFILDYLKQEVEKEKLKKEQEKNKVFEGYISDYWRKHKKRK